MSALAALASSVLVGSTWWVVAPPRRSLAPRLAPHVAAARSRLGSGAHDVPSIGPELSGRTLWARCVHVITERRRLMQQWERAGGIAATYDSFKLAQVMTAAIGALVGLSTGMVSPTVGGLLSMVAMGAGWGWLLPRLWLRRAVGRRASRIESEVSTIAELIAVHLRAGRGPVEAVRSVVWRSGGVLSEELGEALRLLSSGVAARASYERLAARCAHDSGIRLYRLLGLGTGHGTDISDALLAFAQETRQQRRTQFARAAVSRRSAMVLPLLLLLAPVLGLFVAAPIPSILLGGFAP